MLALDRSHKIDSLVLTVDLHNLLSRRKIYLHLVLHISTVKELKYMHYDVCLSDSTMKNVRKLKFILWPCCF